MVERLAAENKRSAEIEAILYCVRERGLAALKDPKNLERLRTMDAAARARLNKRIEELKKN
jgi:hypothetical protein